MQIDELIQHTRRLARRKARTGVSLVHLGASPYIMASAARYHYFRNSIGELAIQRGAELVEIEGHRLCLSAEDGATHAALSGWLDWLALAAASIGLGAAVALLAWPPLQLLRGPR